MAHGLRCFGTGDLAGAEKLFRSALDHEAARTKALEGLVGIAVKRKEPRQAVVHLRELVQREPHNAQARNNLAWYLGTADLSPLTSETMGIQNEIVFRQLADRNHEVVPSRILGIDIQESLVRMARRSAALNGLDRLVEIRQGDVRHPETLCDPMTFDAAVFNPPYRRLRSGRINHDLEKTVAPYEILGTAETAYHGHISKQGPPLLRWVLQQAAWVAVRTDPNARQVYTRIAKRAGTKKAATALGRKLLSYAWSVCRQGHPFVWPTDRKTGPGPVPVWSYDI